MSSEDALAGLRLDGPRSIAFGCLACPLRDDCGGTAQLHGAWGCFPCATCGPGCDLLCPKKRSRQYVEALREVDGFDADRLKPPGRLPRVGSLPRYIPAVHRRIGELRTPTGWAAVPMMELLRGRGTLRPRFGGADEARAAFGFPEGAQLLVVGVGKDRGIERYWRDRRTSRLVAAWREMGVHAFVAPNFSSFLAEPRPQHLFSRKRSLICAIEASRAGTPSIPFLNAVTEYDWEFWFEYLRTHPDVGVVAKEFETGNAHPTVGRQTIERIAQLQQRLGRALHLVAIGGAQFRGSLAAHFPWWSLVDATPYFKSAHWQRFDQVRGDCVRWTSARGADRAELLVENHSRYEEWVRGAGVPSRCAS